MTRRDPASRQKKSLLLSLALGALIVPLAAYGASSLMSDAAEPTATSTPTTTPAPIEAPPTTGPADIGVACGEQGMQLVAAETDGSISEVQQAALDALRDICIAEGSPLPAATSPGGSTPTGVVIQASTGVSAPDDDDDHGGHGRGHDDDDDDEDDHGSRHGRGGDDEHDDDHGGDDD